MAETVIHSSEFVAARTCVEQIIDLRNALRYLGVQVNKKSHMFGDNKLVVNFASLVHSKLHKQHNTLSFHCVHKTVASRCVDFNFLVGPENPADVLSEHWSHTKVRKVPLPLFHHQGEQLKDWSWLTTF